jgi:hypothetical protein
MKFREKVISVLVFGLAVTLCPLNAYAGTLSNNVVQVEAVSNSATAVAYNLTDFIAVVDDGIKNMDSKLVVNYIGNIEPIYADIKASIRNSVKGTYAGSVLSEYNLKLEGTTQKSTVTMSFKYNHTKEQENELNFAVDTILNEIITDDMTDMEKIKAVNDYVVLKTQYSFNNESGVSVYSPYAIIKGNKAVCQAYALFTYKMLDKLGFEVKYVIGNGLGEEHAWNLVKLDGQWYHLDTTWNDPVPDRNGFVSYVYFLMSDQAIGKDHTWKKEDYPSAYDNIYSYFNEISKAKTMDKYIYYTSKTDNNLYKIKVDGTEKQKLINVSVQDFVITQDKIYFNNYSGGGYLYSMNLDGTNLKALNSEHSTELTLSDNILSYKIYGTNTVKTIVLDNMVNNTSSKLENIDNASKDTPSAWAVSSVEKAIGLGLVNNELLNDYQSNITREEFCEIIINIYEKISGKQALVPSVNKFKDTTNRSVLKANLLGIVNGVSEEKFNPKDNITREQIAVMLNKLMGSLSINPILTQEYVSFNDEINISDWAKAAVQTLYKTKIMSGVGEQKINPSGNTSREQAMVLTVKFFEWSKDK